MRKNHLTLSTALVATSALVAVAAWAQTDKHNPARPAPAYPANQDGQVDEEHKEKEPRVLTKKEVNRIRYMELKTLRENRVVADKARAGISREVSTGFLSDMQGHDIDAEWPGKDAFFRLSPEIKLALIARFSDDRYIDKIEIRTDPEVFQTWRTKVMPIVMRGCATSHCHGGAEADKTGLRFVDDPKKTAEAAYTNFLLLDEYEKVLGTGEDAQRYYMLDRNRTQDSLLSAWLLDADQLPVKGPHHPGESKFKRVFHSKEHPSLKVIEDWIGSLRNPHPDYGVSINRKATASAPAKKP